MVTLPVSQINEAFAEESLEKAIKQIEEILKTIRSLPPDKERANTANYLKQELKKMKEELYQYEQDHHLEIEREQKKVLERKKREKEKQEGNKDKVLPSDPRLIHLSISHHRSIEISPMKFGPLPKSRTAAQEVILKRRIVEKELRIHGESGGTDELLIEMNNDAMYWACYRENYPDVVRTIMLKADPNHIPKEGTNGQTALFWAVSRCAIEARAESRVLCLTLCVFCQAKLCDRTGVAAARCGRGWPQYALGLLTASHRCEQRRRQMHQSVGQEWR